MFHIRAVRSAGRQVPHLSEQNNLQLRVGFAKFYRQPVPRIIDKDLNAGCAAVDTDIAVVPVHGRIYKASLRTGRCGPARAWIRSLPPGKI